MAVIVVAVPHARDAAVHRQRHSQLCDALRARERRFDTAAPQRPERGQRPFVHPATRQLRIEGVTLDHDEWAAAMTHESTLDVVAPNRV